MTRRSAEELIEGATRLLAAAGLDAAHCPHVARTLVGADLLGYSSHGLSLLPRYLDEIDDGRTARTGAPEIVRDNGSNLTIEGQYLPGAAVMHFALDHMLDRIDPYGAVIAVIRQSQHIGCLSTYLERATERGCAILILSSNPQARIVAPFGGTKPAYTPNPLACGMPTEGDPILIDTSMSSVSFNRVREHRERGEQLPADYLFDNQGRATTDPNALFTKPTGAIRPFGGSDLGYKGFALALMIEAFTSGLAGFGRSDSPTASSNAVFILIAAADAFGGSDHMRREMTGLANACRAATLAPGDHVRIPGERALAKRREQIRDGILVKPTTVAALAERARKFGVASMFEAIQQA